MGGDVRICDGLITGGLCYFFVGKEVAKRVEQVELAGLFGGLHSADNYSRVKSI